MRTLAILGGLALFSASAFAFGTVSGDEFSSSPSGSQELILNGTIVLSPIAAGTGWWDDTGYHDSTNPNYIVGYCPSCVNGPYFNDYFAFDIPSDLTITSAVLSIGNGSTGYNSTIASETLNIDSVSTSIAALTAAGTGQTSIYNALDSGTLYGSTTVNAATDGTQVTITLDAAALAALNTLSDSGGGDIAFGGYLADPASGVPEPSTAGLLGMGAVALAGLIRRRNRNKA